MKYVLTFILVVRLAGSTLSQATYAVQDTAYIQAVEKAFAALKQGDCKTCLAQYQRAFMKSQKSAVSALRAAACAYQCQHTEQARQYIQKAVSTDFWISEDVWEKTKDYPELALLRTSSLAADFQDYVDKQKLAEGRNPALERELKQIFRADNQPRLRMDTIGRQYGYNSAEAKPLWEVIGRADSINLIKVERMFQQYGYPGKRLVGEKQNITAWLVIQHAPLAVQEKYFPLIRKAADAGDLEKANLALLIDRIRVRKGQKQLYGSQVQNGPDGKPQGFMAIDDEAHVNKRRAEMGLQPLEDYARYFGVEYVLPK